MQRILHYISFNLVGQTVWLPIDGNLTYRHKATANIDVIPKKVDTLHQQFYFQSGDNNKNERAQLITKPFAPNIRDKTYNPPCGMKLWYYMYGKKVGNLTVYLQ